MGSKYKELDKSTVIQYYKRPEIQEAIASFAQNKEVVGSFGGKGYAKRPDIIQFPSDVFSQVQRGITSFHMSEETWHNPLLLEPGMKKKDQDELRKGWDLILDIDSKLLDTSQFAADLLVQALNYNGVKSATVKFSGNHGFHIAVPFESFPSVVQDKEIHELFPAGAQKIAEYLNDMIKDHLAKRILEKYPEEELIKALEITQEDLKPQGEFNPFAVVDIDTILISSRHLFRMPYSLNEKSGLVSIPIKNSEILNFTREKAKPENVTVDVPFLDRKLTTKDEAKNLFVAAFDFVAPQKTISIEEEKINRNLDFEELQEKIPEELFPPCITNILKGISDGKKRSLFILTNFLRSSGWSYEEIEDRLMKWNEVCPEQLREVNIKGHVRYHKQNKKQVLPPNCDNKAYYSDMQFCTPDNFCQKVKNPASYARKKSFLIEQNKTPTQKKKEQKQRDEKKENEEKSKESKNQENSKEEQSKEE